MSDLVLHQKELCLRFGAGYESLDLNLNLGVSENLLSGVLPLNGLRHPPERDTCGWYLWPGEELSEAPDFFQPWHVYHLVERRPDIAKYLGLAPGWRFMVASDYEDVWFDLRLLEV